MNIAYPNLLKLINEGVVVGDAKARPGERWAEYDPAWRHVDLWQRRVALGFRFETAVALENVIRVKLMLRCSDVEFDDTLLIALGRLRNGKALSARESYQRLRSTRAVCEAASKRYAELHSQRLDTRPVYPPLELSEILEDAPVAFLTMPGTCVDSRRSALYEKPPLALTSRVGAMPADRLRWLATLVIIVHPLDGGSSSINRILDVIDYLRDRVGSEQLGDPDAVSSAVQRLVNGKDLSRSGIVQFIKSYLQLQSLVRNYAEWQGMDGNTGHGAFVISLNLPNLSPEISARLQVQSDLLSIERLQARALKAGEVVRRARSLQVSLHARFRQWSRLTQRVEAMQAEIRQKIDQGDDVDFPIGISDTWFVVRPDGTVLPHLKQRVSLEIVSEDYALLEAAEAAGWPATLRNYMAANLLSRWPAAKCGKRRIGSGIIHQPGGNRRFYVRYAGTDPASDPSDEHHEPFLIQFYRNSVFVQSSKMHEAKLAKRDALIAQHDLEVAPRAMLGLTWWVSRKNAALPHLLQQITGMVILPMSELRLMLAYGTAVARLELMTGQRIGETMQARYGGGFGPQSLPDGRIVHAMRGRPKGKRRDRWWVIDPSTMALLRQIKQWSIDMWYSETGSLPFVKYGLPAKDRDRVPFPRAQYLFQINGAAADDKELRRCLRLTTLGIVYARAHDYRYAFGKLLSMRGVPRRLRAMALSHETDERSSMPEQYCDWEADGLSTADAFVAEYQDEQLADLLEGFLDAGIC